MTSYRVFCPECGAVRIRGPRGLAVCHAGHGKLVPNWTGWEDLPTAFPDGFVRLGRGQGRRRAYHVVGDPARYRLAEHPHQVDGRVLANDHVLVFVIYREFDGVAVGRTRLLQRIQELDVASQILQSIGELGVKRKARSVKRRGQRERATT